MEYLRRATYNPVPSSIHWRFSPGHVALPWHHRLVDSGCTNRHDSLVRVDALLEIHQAYHSFREVSSRRVLVANIDTFRLASRHHQDVCILNIERGELTIHCRDIY